MFLFSSAVKGHTNHRDVPSVATFKTKAFSPLASTERVTACLATTGRDAARLQGLQQGGEGGGSPVRAVVQAVVQGLPEHRVLVVDAPGGLQH